MTSTGPLRIAVANWSARRVGGVEEHLTGVIRALHESGSAVSFFHETDAPADRRRIPLPEGVLDICPEDHGLNDALATLRQWRPDVVYLHGMKDPAIERQLMQIAPAVFFLHAYTGTCISGRKTFTRPSARPCGRRFGWPCLAHYFPHGCGGRSPLTMWTHFREQSSRLDLLRNYATILTHSEHMRMEMDRHGLVAEVVPYPVRMPSSPVVRSESDSWRLLYVARMDVLKGGRLLLDAIAMVSALAKRDISLTLAGDGPDRATLEAHAREMMRPGVRTVFAGWVAPDAVSTLMRQADLLVVPSVWPEPFGSVGPEAGHHGLPTAAFDVGGIRTWLTDGVGGHLAPADPPTAQGLAHAIIRCLEDSAHYAALRAGAREMADRFTMSQHLPVLMAAMERAAAR